MRIVTLFFVVRRLSRNFFSLFNVYTNDPDLIERLVTLVRPDILNLVNDFEPRSRATKDAVSEKRLGVKTEISSDIAREAEASQRKGNQYS